MFFGVYEKTREGRKKNPMKKRRTYKAHGPISMYARVLEKTKVPRQNPHELGKKRCKLHGPLV